MFEGPVPPLSLCASQTRGSCIKRHNKGVKSEQRVELSVTYRRCGDNPCSNSEFQNVVGRYPTESRAGCGGDIPVCSYPLRKPTQMGRVVRQTLPEIGLAKEKFVTASK